MKANHLGKSEDLAEAVEAFREGFEGWSRARSVGVWRSWLARMHGVHEVVGSSPATPTITQNRRFCAFSNHPRSGYHRKTNGFAPFKNRFYLTNI